MAFIFGTLAAAYAYQKYSQNLVRENEMEPNNPSELPPMDKYNPAKNDLIQPKAWWYDPNQIGDVSRLNSDHVYGPYPEERYIGPEAAYDQYSLIRSQNYKDKFVQQQLGVINDRRELDNNFKDKGLAPHPRILDLGYPFDEYVPAPTKPPVPMGHYSQR